MGNTYEEKLKMEWEKFSSKKNKFFFKRRFARVKTP